MFEPRQYQHDAVDGLRDQLRAGKRRVLLQAGTGAGKTVIASMVIEGADSKGSSVVFLAHRRELVYQAHAKLTDAGVDAGIIMAGEPMRGRRVQVCSIQTLMSPSRRREGLPPCDLLVIDECHRSLAPSYLQLIEAYPDAAVLGLTATPARSDGRGLGAIYEGMVQCPGISELQEQGFLVPTRYFAPSKPDLEGVKVRMGDYVETDLAGRMDRPKLIGDVVEHWGRFAADRPTIVFATGVQHSMHLCERFRDAGVRAEHVDGTTEKDERDQIWKRLSNGDLQVVTNCMVATEGLDVPCVSAIVLARPTKSIVMYLQMVGRGMRPSPGKTDCMVIDHAGAVHEHGFVEEFTDWSLDPDKVQANPTQEKRRENEATVIVCSECFCEYVGRPQCPNCGAQHKPKAKEVAYVDAVLGEVSKKTRETAKPEYSMRDKMRWHAELQGVAEERGYKPGWVFHQYKAKFGVEPRKGMSTVALPPSPEVRSWVKSRMIAFAKARGKAA